MDAARYLKETPMLDYSSVMIQSLIAEKGWRELDAFHQIKEIYRFVRDEILFGYNVSDRDPSLLRAGRRIWPVQYQRDAVYGPFAGRGDSLPGSWLYHR